MLVPANKDCGTDVLKMSAHDKNRKAYQEDRKKWLMENPSQMSQQFAKDHGIDREKLIAEGKTKASKKDK